MDLSSLCTIDYTPRCGNCFSATRINKDDSELSDLYDRVAWCEIHLLFTDPNQTPEHYGCEDWTE